MKKHLPLESAKNLGSTKSDQRQTKTRRSRSDLFKETKTLAPFVFAPIFLPIDRWIE
jgi:hypothetical protein